MPALTNENEVEALAARFGAPLHWARTAQVSDPMFQKRKDALTKNRGEAVLVVPRPQGRVLLHTKAFYPPGAYRLPSGAIKIGEGVKEAVARELAEETGFRIGIERFLGLIEYEFGSGGDKAAWVSYIFLMDETDAQPHVADTGEGIADFREVRWEELEHVAFELEQLPGDWRDWGRFRAVAHRLVAQAISQK